MKKYVVLLSSLLFAASVAAVDCTDCHEPMDDATHEGATLATCDDCHAMGEHHTDLDKDVHTPELTATECADCHGTK